MRRVLIIEDSPTDTQLFRLAIDERETEIQVSIVATWQEADAIITDRTKVLRLILLDLNLPMVGGREIIQIVRRRGVHVPIIVFSTSSSPTDIVACYREGASGYIVKPYDVGELFETLCTTFKYWLEVNKLGEEVYE